MIYRLKISQRQFVTTLLMIYKDKFIKFNKIIYFNCPRSIEKIHQWIKLTVSAYV